jgi:hypothetical protein
MIVQIGPDFSVADVSFSDQYWTNHEDLERDGAIRHKGGVCPSRQPQLIRRWSPGVGWQDLKITPTIRSIVDSPQR